MLYPTAYAPRCTRCPRLSAFLAELRREHPDYWNRPVPSFGDPQAPLLLIGLAPGLHGANRTGRPFTGDHAGILLYRSLYEAGLASGPHSVSAGDGLLLSGVRIINAAKCVPPQNKPLPAEVRSCNGYLARELRGARAARVFLALGRIAHEALLLAQGLPRAAYPFAHGREHELPDGRQLLDSYHCSRYNTQTGRLTVEMFQAVLARGCELAGLKRA
ncbi:MAG: uracil-DNA glycosylase [Gammaproteobacteria bacterium]|nr:uracil-DNA glycosylase [Gammaproteobacteria bacterium]